MYKVIVKEQKPTSTSIFCGFKLVAEGGNSVVYNNMYFVCNLDKKVIQYPIWLNSEQNYKQQIINLGYNFK